MVASSSHLSRDQAVGNAAFRAREGDKRVIYQTIVDECENSAGWIATLVQNPVAASPHTAFEYHLFVAVRING